jgi:hypothetical protein
LRTRSAIGASGTLRAGRAGGTWRTGGANGTGVAGNVRLAPEKGEEVEAGVRGDTRRHRRRKRAHDIVAERDDFLATDANTTERDSVNNGARVGDLCDDRTVRAVRLGDDADGAVAAIQRRHHRREAIPVVVRDRHYDTRVDAAHHRTGDVTHEIAIVDASGATGAIDDDRVA